MIEIAGAFLVAMLGALLFRVQLRRVAQLERDIRLERLEWCKERRELLNRIQAPQFVPQPQVGWQAPEQREPDEFDLVGAIMEASKPDEG